MARSSKFPGSIDDQGRPDADSILVPETCDPGEEEWLRAAAMNPAFDFLDDSEEDAYTVLDGQPFHKLR